MRVVRLLIESFSRKQNTKPTTAGKANIAVGIRELFSSDDTSEKKKNTLVRYKYLLRKMRFPRKRLVQTSNKY